MTPRISPQWALFRIAHNLPEGMAIDVEEWLVVEAARADLDSLLFGHLHLGDVDKFVEKIERNWEIQITRFFNRPYYRVYKPPRATRPDPLYATADEAASALLTTSFAEES